MSRRRIDRLLLIAATGVLVAASSACGTDFASTTPGSRSSAVASSSVAADARVADAQCDETPPSGSLTRAPGGLVFARGDVRVRVERLAVPIAPEKVPSATDPAADDGCFSYPRWGNADVVVPVGSALFVFKNARDDGVIIEVALFDVVSRAQMTGQVGVVLGGRHHLANTCTITMSEVTEARAAGSFTCPSASSVEGNPFAPRDEIDPTDRAPETSSPVTTTPGQPGPAPIIPPPTETPTTTQTPTTPSVSLKGWFVLDR